MEEPRKLFPEALFYVRASAFFISCLGIYGSPTVNFVLIGLIILTWIIDFLVGNTTWISVRWETYACFVPLLAGIFWLTQLAYGGSLVVYALAPVGLLALSSDAIANSRRWRKLFFFMLITIMAVLDDQHLFNRAPFPAFILGGLPTGQFLCALIPGFACLARLFFPRTKHLIHTSLDYPPVRLEILSFGMKRPAAIGIKKM